MSDSSSPLVLSARGLTKTFTEVREPVTVLSGVNLDVPPGARIAVIGASGSGKSTLLHLLGGLDVPTEGTVHIAGQDMTQLSDAARGRLRNEQMGFIYQFHHLLPEFTTVENVAMPLLLRRGSNGPALSRARELLKKVGLGQRLDHKPTELSGGERQRAAVARALVSNPACILADEPTGNLDHRTAASVFDMMLELNSSLDTSLVMVTHDRSLAQRMDEIWTLTDGHLAPAEAEELTTG
ncbi:lipoprotein-releasing ABC transporter ATP-binding protein LolD [Salinisphaera sp. Q1T1-3]|uniref:lipoprotein-releasing ABC transporter ATP-binding protein LolD n=1 Tax=Salinisphaera sp. Q1T1-3 TaxID=2321229 RepID=UPI000E71320B|nr:lipoprotein-releasing ABC transporter ATP-binding protein LolD [Salinisphaera sp. Q1T1-3]RJS92034.1 lipoprotein-releasing ABC transporter ATP-binding protein LolD [Salinisphaera sp. Q1T1-3]